MNIKIPFTTQPVYDYETKEIVGYAWRAITLYWDHSKDIFGVKKYDWTTHSATDNKFYALRHTKNSTSKFLKEHVISGTKEAEGMIPPKKALKLPLK